MSVHSRISEIVLFLLLVLLLASMRIYLGGPAGLIWVWKGAPSFNDTVVDLQNYQSMSRDELKRDHNDVMWQLEDMGFIEESKEHAKRREKLQSKPARPVARNQSKAIIN